MNSWSREWGAGGGRDGKSQHGTPCQVWSRDRSPGPSPRATRTSTSVLVPGGRHVACTGGLPGAGLLGRDTCFLDPAAGQLHPLLREGLILCHNPPVLWGARHQANLTWAHS